MQEEKQNSEPKYVHVDIETKKLRILAEFLLPDNRTNKCSYIRFDKIITLIQGENSFDTLKIFKEIVGADRKYITFGRLKAAFQAYKSNSKEKSIEFKNFFSFLFNTVLQVEGASCGRSIPNSSSGTTEKNKSRNFVSSVKVYQNGNKITGIQVEYDGSIKSKILSPEFKNFNTTLDLRLNQVNINGKPSEFRDYVTHVFGTYTVKLEFIGFKTTTGKFYFVGDFTLGTPFVIGKFGEKFHGVKCGLKDGISYVKPSFKRGMFTSTIPHYADEENYEEDQLIDDEEQVQKLTGSEKEWALYYFDEDEANLSVPKEKDENPGDSWEKVFYNNDVPKIPLSTQYTEEDFSAIKKKVAPLIKPNKNQKQIQEEEKKRNEVIQAQIDEHNQKKKEDQEKIRSKLDKPINVSEKVSENDKIFYSQDLPKKGIFNDRLFTPDYKSLIPGKKIPEGIEEDEVEGWSDIKWVKAKEIFAGDDYQVFIDKIEPSDILQGQLGNCYFLSAVATIAQEHPDVVNKLFLFANRSNDGCYGIYARVRGHWKLILLDDSFPSKNNYGTNEFAFTRSNGNELWVLLLEKAWAKLCGGYVNIIGGLPSEVFNTFTDSYTETIDVKKIGEEVLWEKLLEGEKLGFLMGAGTGSKGQDVGLTPGHAYSLLRVKEIYDHGVTTRLLELRNPWGEGEWTGDWSDNSEKWTRQLREECQVSAVEDGKFWMNLKDFSSYFEIINICKIHPGFTSTYINYKKNQVSEPIATTLEVTEDSTVYLQIHQRYKRFRLRDGTFPNQVAFFIMLLDENLQYIDSAWSDNNVECIQTELKKGKYHVVTDISYRFIEGQRNHGYTVSSYSEKATTLTHDTEASAEELLKAGLISFAKQKIKPVTPNGLKQLKKEKEANFYKKTLGNPFPGQIFVFENLSKDLVFEGSVRLDNSRGAGIYDHSTHLYRNESYLTVEVKPKTTEVIFVRYGESNPKVSYLEEKSDNGESIPMVIKETLEQLEKRTFSQGTKAEIDEGTQVIEYTLETKTGFGIGFINNSKKSYRITVEWELKNLQLAINQGQSKVEFELGPKKTFFEFLQTTNKAIKSSYDEGLSYDEI